MLQLGAHKRLSASESLPNETICSGAARCEFVAFDKWLRRIGLQWSTSRLVRARIVSDSQCDWLFGIVLFSSNHLYQLQSRTSDSCAISLFHYKQVSLTYNEKIHFVVSTFSKTKCKHYYNYYYYYCHIQYFAWRRSVFSAILSVPLPTQREMWVLWFSISTKWHLKYSWACLETQPKVRKPLDLQLPNKNCSSTPFGPVGVADNVWPSTATSSLDLSAGQSSMRLAHPSWVLRILASQTGHSGLRLTLWPLWTRGTKEECVCAGVCVHLWTLLPSIVLVSMTTMLIFWSHIICQKSLTVPGTGAVRDRI